MDWITDAERLSSISQTCLREPLPYISLVFMYIDKTKQMTSFHKDTLLLTEQILSKDVLGKLIASHKKDAYSLKESFLFHIPIEPEVVPIYHENSYKTSWSQVYPLLADIPLPPSIFIFHPFNTLYFIYHEDFKKSSIRKTTGIGKSTKKVRWSISHKNNITRAKHPP
jgi:hypothetical protein